MREIHEIQEKLYGEEKNLSVKERLLKIRHEAGQLIGKYGLRFKTYKKVA